MTVKQDKEHRPDSTVTNPQSLNLGGWYNKMIIDVAYTSPLDGAINGEIRAPKIRTEAMKIGDHANAKYQIKYNKYKKLIDSLPRQLNLPNIYIQPFVFETTGLLQKKGLELLERMADYGEGVMKIPGVNLLTFFKRRLACKFAKELAAAINLKGYQKRSHADTTRDHTFDDRHVLQSLPDCD